MERNAYSTSETQILIKPLSRQSRGTCTPVSVIETCTGRFLVPPLCRHGPLRPSLFDGGLWKMTHRSFILQRAMNSASIRTAKTNRWRRRKAERPSEIISAALDLFVEHGFSATRLQDVAQSAGVAKGTLYRYFDDKEALFRAVVEEVILPELAQTEDMVRQHDGDTPELLRRLVHYWWSKVGETKLCGIPKLVTAEANNFPTSARFFVEKVIRRGRRLFEGVLKQGIERGELRPFDVKYGARLLIAPLVFAAIWERSLRAYDPEPYRPRKLVDMHVESFLAAYGIDKTPARRRPV